MSATSELRADGATRLDESDEISHGEASTAGISMVGASTITAVLFDLASCRASRRRRSSSRKRSSSAEESAPKPEDDECDEPSLPSRMGEELSSA